MKPKFALIALTVCALSVSCANGQQSKTGSENPVTAAPQIPRGVEEGQLFTDFAIPQADGSTVRLSDYVGRGKWVLVDFWASWCGPCRGEIPNIKNVWEKYHGKQFEVVSVAVWDKPADTKAAIAEEGLKWPQVINAQRIPTDIYGIEGIPHIILFGPDGVIIKRDLRGPEIEEAVKAALAH